jgi:hypothetical protein
MTHFFSALLWFGAELMPQLQIRNEKAPFCRISTFNSFFPGLNPYLLVIDRLFDNRIRLFQDEETPAKFRDKEQKEASSISKKYQTN